MINSLAVVVLQVVIKAPVLGRREVQSASPPSVIVQPFSLANLLCPAIPAEALISQPPYLIGDAQKIFQLDTFCLLRPSKMAL